MKPFLKWAGGKRRLVPFISNLIDNMESRRLIEPFMGGGSIFAATNFKSYVLNDSNPDLITLYKTLMNNKDSLIEQVKQIFIPENNTLETYKQLRTLYNSIPEGSSERSALFVYLNKHAFNGMYRVNAKGGYNIPFARYKSVKAPIEDMDEFSNKLNQSDVKFHTGDFQSVMETARYGDVIYCDPPYSPLSKTASFTSYAKEAFGPDEHKRLVEIAQKMAKSGAQVIISNHDTDETRELYKDAIIHEINVQRMIGAKSESRIKVPELIAVYDGYHRCE